MKNERKSTTDLKILLDSTDEGIFELDLQGKCAFMNKAAAQMLGFDPDDIFKLDEPLHNIIHYAHPDGSPYAVADCPIYRAFLAGKGCHIEDEVLWRSNGIPFPVEYSSFPILEEGNIKGAVVTFRGIAWRLEIEKSLRAERDRYQQLLIEMRETQEKLIETEKMAVLGTLVAGIAHEINSPLGAINASISNISYSLNEILNQLPRIMTQVTAEKLKFYIDLLLKTLEKNADILYERKLKKSLILRLEREQIDHVDEVADTLIDMGIYNNIEPYLPILKDSHGQLMLEFGYHVCSAVRNCRNITDAASRASKIVLALKGYSHYQDTGEKTQEDICAGIDMALTIHRNQIKHGINVIKNYQEVPPLFAYHDELNQVWSNLIQNAIQAMENKGTLIIDVLQKEGNIIVKFTDTGHGLSEQAIANLFKPFFTTKAAGEGSGIGLSIVKKIIDKHAGDITVTSIPGETTFTVMLPIQSDLT